MPLSCRGRLPQRRGYVTVSIAGRTAASRSQGAGIERRLAATARFRSSTFAIPLSAASTPPADAIKLERLAATARFRRSSTSSTFAIPLSAASTPPADAIKLVASDVDGTLLLPSQKLDPRVARAVAACERDANVPFILATGKAPGAAWFDRLLTPENLGAVPRAGVFMQGLFVSDAKGRVLYSRSLDPAVVEAVAELVEANAGRLTLTAYCTPSSRSPSTPLRTRILSSGDAGDRRAERLVFFGEPKPEPATPLPGASTGATAIVPTARSLGLDIHKLIVMFDHEDEANEGLDGQLRAAIVALLASDDNEDENSSSLCVSMTSALPGMTEVLPPGASKADGVLRYLGEVELPPHNLLAIGDAENDVEMLLLAGIGAAVANAGQGAMQAADVVVPSNAEGGVADAIEKFVLEPRGLRIPAV